MLLDDYLPLHHFSERHERVVQAPAGLAFTCLLELDMRRAPLVGLLFSLRELPWRLSRRGRRSPGLGLTLEGLVKAGFIPLAQDPPRELVLGLVGRPWRPDPDPQRLTPAQFASFGRVGYVKVASNLTAEPLNRGRSLLCTETRIQCLGHEAKRGFRRYWTIIRPFSGLIRRQWLALAARQAEALARAGRAGR